MHPIEEKLIASWPLEKWQDRAILLAVSGGTDSVAMLRAIHRLKGGGTGRLLVAHFNHGLRGEESDADERFVIELAETLGLDFHHERARGSGGSEESLRSARYEFFQRTAEQMGARYIVTAHTADDQVETILHRVLRGTGMAGLAGIPRSRPLGDAAVLLRPMLGITRREVLDYLQSLDQPYREDTTNAETDFTRNRIRHELLPLLAKNYNPNVAEAILRLGQLASDAQTIIRCVTDDLLESRVKIGSLTSVEVDCGRFGVEDRPVVRELLASVWKRQSWPLAEMGFAEWDRLATLALGDSAQPIDLPGPVCAQKKGALLSLTRLELQISSACRRSGPAAFGSAS